MRKLFTLVFAISLFLYAPIQAQNGGMHIKGPAKPILKTGTYLIINGDLKVSITDGLIIKPSTYVTVKGDMSLDARKAITVQTSISLIPDVDLLSLMATQFIAVTKEALKCNRILPGVRAQTILCILWAPRWKILPPVGLGRSVSSNST